MKLLTLKARFSNSLCLLVLAGGTAIAQVPGGGSPTSISKAFVKLFSAVGPFSAKVEARVFDSHQTQIVQMPMDFAALDGKVRLDINLAQLQSQDLTPSIIEGLKQTGMDRVVSIFRPDKNLTYALYPGIQSYKSVPLTPADAAVSEKSLKLEKTSLGKGTINGHPCVKNKTVVKNGAATAFEAITWNATDLKDFPIQIEIPE
jgi:hypothetical protein